MTTELTDRELAILHGYAAGRTRSRVARELRLSVKTVDTYTSRMFAKLNAATEAQAVHHAHQLGLFGEPAPLRAPTPALRRVWDNPDATARRRAVLNEALRGYQRPRKAA
jgi:DNA-binding CsgD family transcriptional regulator